MSETYMSKPFILQGVITDDLIADSSIGSK
jgi:hypothetical protein